MYKINACSVTTLIHYVYTCTVVYQCSVLYTICLVYVNDSHSWEKGVPEQNVLPIAHPTHTQDSLVHTHKEGTHGEPPWHEDGPGPLPRCDLLPWTSPHMHVSDCEPATAVESQEWSPCYRGGRPHLGTMTHAPSFMPL